MRFFARVRADVGAGEDRDAALGCCRGGLAVAIAASGCGDDDDGTSATPKAVAPEIWRPARQRVDRAAVAVRGSGPRTDTCPGPMVMRTVCSPPTRRRSTETPTSSRATSRASALPPGKDRLTYMTYEDWLVPVDAQGKVGEPTIRGQARIRAYRRKDNRLNCTNRAARPGASAPRRFRAERLCRAPGEGVP